MRDSHDKRAGTVNGVPVGEEEMEEVMRDPLDPEDAVRMLAKAQADAPPEPLEDPPGPQHPYSPALTPRNVLLWGAAALLTTAACAALCAALA